MFPPVIPLYKVGCSRVTHPSAADPPMNTEAFLGFSARLACVRHAASVRPEPGSNSPFKTFIKSLNLG